MVQVRLTDDVAQAVQQKAIASGRSLSAEADVWLRRALGLNPGRPSPAAERNMVPDPAPAQQVITPPQGRGAMGAPISRAGWQGPRPR